MKRRLTRGQCAIAAEIKRLHQSGEPLNITAVKRRHPELIKAVYVLGRLGWKKAIEDAGIGYAGISVQLSDYVTCHICGKQMGHLCSHLPRVHDISPEEYMMDYPHGEIICESTSALHFGRRIKCERPRNMRHWEPVWSPEYILDRLAEMHRSGMPVYLIAVRNVEASLPEQCVKYFGAYYEAIRRIGLDPTKIRKHTDGIAPEKQEVLDLIKKRHSLGKSLSLSKTLGEAGGRIPGFTSAIHRCFGSWRNAVETAGFDYIKLCKGAHKYRTKQEVIRGIRHRRRTRQPLNWTGLASGIHKNRALYNNGSRLFGTWQNAVRATGLSIESISVPRAKYPDKRAVIKAIRRRERDGLDLSSRSVYMTDRALIRAIYRLFRSYPLAMKAAGVSRGYRRLSKRKVAHVQLKNRQAKFDIRTRNKSPASHQ